MAAAWTLVGVSGLFASAVLRLGGRGVETILDGLGPLEWTILTALTLFMVYMEGVLTFQRRWVPKLIERARAVRGEPILLQLLAPLYGLSLVGGPAKRVLRGWLGTVAIVGAVLAVRALPAASARIRNPLPKPRPSGPSPRRDRPRRRCQGSRGKEPCT